MTELTSLPLSHASGVVPDWVHLLPAGVFPAVGGKTRLRADNPKAIIAASLTPGKIVLDENHATDLAAPRGKAAPALGWIVAMEARRDGIWGRVDWTQRGRDLMNDRAYRAISPVLVSQNGVVVRVLRASLTNNPDLPLTTLHHTPNTPSLEEPTVTYPQSELCARLGLPADADRATVDRTLDAAATLKTFHSRAASLAGLDTTAQPDAVLNALKSQQEQVTLHSANMEKMRNQLNRLEGERFVEQAGRQKAISADLATQLITLHASNPEVARSVVDSLPDAPNHDVTLHGATHHSITPKGPDFSAFDREMGLTSDDVKGL